MNKVWIVTATCALWVGGLRAEEWTDWRGPTHDGVSGETELVSSWSLEGENLLWRVDFIGRSTPVVLDGQACVIGRVGTTVDRQEVVACYDAETGRKNWEHLFPVYNTSVPFNRVGWPSLAADPETGNIYAHGVAGQLTAFDRTGKILWSHFLTEEYGRLSGYGGRTQTPLVDGDQLILSSVSSGWGEHAAPRHRYFSFDKRTGAVLWIATPGGMPYDMNSQSVPIVAEIGGRRLLVAGDADGWIYALDVATGEKVWGFQLSRRGINSNVVVSGDRVFVSHSEENIDDGLMGRLVCIDGTGKGDVTKTNEVWRVNELEAGYSSPTHHGGKLYVVDNGANLHAIDEATGHVIWNFSLGTVGKGSPVWADGKIYVTEVNGRFHVVEPGPEGARQLDLDVLHVASGRYAEIYGSPAIAYGRIFFATENGLFCLGKKGRPIPKQTAPRAAVPAAGEGEPALVRVVPAEVLIRPDESASFELRAFDAKGRPLGVRNAEWKLTGLAGTIEGGTFKAGGAKPQAGTVGATLGALTASARVRVVPALPWADDFESYAAGQSPPTWVGAPKKFEVKEHEGNKVLAKLFRDTGVLRNETYLGPSTLRNYTIEADVMGGGKGKRLTDVGLIANGYQMDMSGNHQRLELSAWQAEDRIKAEAPFAWEMGRWYHMKLRVDVKNGTGLVRGKVWPKEAQEPAEWTITAEDPYPVASGSPGLTGYSPADILYDNLKVTENER